MRLRVPPTARPGTLDSVYGPVNPLRASDKCPWATLEDPDSQKGHPITVPAAPEATLPATHGSRAARGAARGSVTTIHGATCTESQSFLAQQTPGCLW